MNKRSFQDCRLYVIIDREACAGRDPVEVTQAAIRGGADCVQWRDKTASDRSFFEAARRLRETIRGLNALFIVNDRLHIALAAGADGVHLGHEDLPVRQARAVAGRRLLIGRSTHSLQEALAAQASGADYIGVGPVFSTPTKPDYPTVGLDLIRQVKESLRIPWFAIGGIDLSSLPLVLSAGANRAAVVRAVTGASDPEAAARALKAAMAG